VFASGNRYLLGGASSDGGGSDRRRKRRRKGKGVKGGGLLTYVQPIPYKPTQRMFSDGGGKNTQATRVGNNHEPTMGPDRGEPGGTSLRPKAAPHAFAPQPPHPRGGGGDGGQGLGERTTLIAVGRASPLSVAGSWGEKLPLQFLFIGGRAGGHTGRGGPGNGLFQWAGANWLGRFGAGAARFQFPRGRCLPGGHQRGGGRAGGGGEGAVTRKSYRCVARWGGTKPGQRCRGRSQTTGFDAQWLERDQFFGGHGPGRQKTQLGRTRLSLQKIDSDGGGTSEGLGGERKKKVFPRRRGCSGVECAGVVVARGRPAEFFATNKTPRHGGGGRKS